MSFAGILALLGTIAPWINMIINFFSGRAKATSGAAQSMEDAKVQHQNDGAQSVASRTSVDAQMDALDQLEDQLDNPTPIVVVKGKP